MPAVDCHAHVFSADAPAAHGARYRPAYAATLAEWEAQWHGAGITHGVLVQPSFFGTDNAEMVDAIALDRESLRGIAVVDPSFDDGSLARLAAEGIVGLRYNLHGVDDLEPRFDGEWRRLLERCAAQGWHLEVFTDAGAAPRVARALASIPIAVVFDHFAMPDGADPGATYSALAQLAHDRPVYCKLSAPYRLHGVDAGESAHRCIEALGRGHVVWGSDWPFTRHEERATYGRMRSALETACGPRVDDILWDNAAQLYRLA